MDGTSSSGFSKSMILGVIGGVLLAIGSFLVWATASVNFDKLAAALGVDPAVIPASVRAGSSTSVTGWKGGDGKWTFAAGIVVVVAAVLFVAMAQNMRIWAAVMLVGGVVGGGVALYDISTLKSKTADTAALAFTNAGIPGKASDYFSIKIGIGLWICVLGGIIAIAGGVMSIGKRVVGMPAAAGMAAPTDSGFGAPPASSMPTPAPSMPTPAPSMPTPAPSEPTPVETETTPPEPGSDAGGAGTPSPEDTGGDGSTTS